ncbi:hypothetical protein DP73_17170 [Desulfosporosinus sp. HMP52]|uniref:hypothetical protein n=1 Tax=Desulfosporosinus sp. HMP52 TaxID=1487923 RepID=UPI00051FAC55|nr:hypothetical protein [Desulfosporosinus sp. HMP52]KGK86312.1 hypothetical protein DP73_17170 [Desulfosporosinus sp. HMP52]
MKKKIIIITSIMLLLLTGAGVWGYNNFFKSDPKIQQQLNNQFGEDFFKSFDDEIADENPGASNEQQTKGMDLAGDAPRSELATEKVQQGNAISDTATDGNQGSLDKEITKEQVISKYQPKFNNLQNAALGRLDTLYTAAAKEYEQLRKAGTLNRSALAQKYIQAGTMLEANVDNQFYSTLNAMQAELEANKLPTDVIASTKAAYEQAKSNKRAQLLSKVRN